MRAQLCAFLQNNSKEVAFITDHYLQNSGQSLSDYMQQLNCVSSVSDIMAFYFMAVMDNIPFAVLSTKGLWYSDLEKLITPQVFLVWRGDNVYQEAIQTEWFPAVCNLEAEMPDCQAVIQALLTLHDSLPPSSVDTICEFMEQYDTSQDALYIARQEDVHNVK